MQKLLLQSLAVLAALGSSPVMAQDMDTFSFSGSMFDRQGTLQLAHPHLGKAGTYYAGLGLTYADSPLVAVFPSGREEEVVASQISTRLQAGYNLGRRVRFDLDVPVYPSVRKADSLDAGTQTFESVFAMGNIRVGALLPLLSYDDNGVGVAANPYIDIPTGSKDAYLSNGGVAGGVTAAVAGQHGIFGWTLNGGVSLMKATSLDDTFSLGNNVNGGLGLHLNLGSQFLVGAEGTTILPFVDGFDPWNKKDIEAHLYGTYTSESGLLGTLSLGTGLLAGVGAPDFRVALALAYSPVEPPDRDGDGIVDDDDRCPDDPEDKDNFEDTDGCPDRDNDKDGILDTSDSCPNDPEDKDGFEDANGCPDPDNDKDGTLDADDVCPIDPGPKNTKGCPDKDGDTVVDSQDECVNDPGPVATKGCPDRDGDLVPDFRDKCPDEPVDRRADPEHSDGCPSKVVLAKEQIVILDKVYFDFNKATIKPVSYTLLDDVAKVINNNPQLKMIEVGGHTDDVGSDEYNKKLSQARVDAVMAYLIKKGHVDPTRLSAVGYGETKPIAPNTDEEGRATNRRVEFNILKQE